MIKHTVKPPNKVSTPHVIVVHNTGKTNTIEHKHACVFDVKSYMNRFPTRGNCEIHPGRPTHIILLCTDYWWQQWRSQDFSNFNGGG